MKVQDLCVCDVATVNRETSLARAGTLMSRFQVGALPVVDRNDRVIGMITDRDALLEVVRRNTPASEIHVDEVMSHRPATVRPEDDVMDALEEMKNAQVRRLPVVDEEGRLEGIVSIDDIICHAAQDGGKRIPYDEIVDSFCSIVEEYTGEEPQRSSHNSGRAEHSSRSGGRRKYRYENDEPEFEREERPRQGRLRQGGRGRGRRVRLGR